MERGRKKKVRQLLVGQVFFFFFETMHVNVRIRVLSDLVLFMASVVSLWLGLQERGEFPFMTEQQGWFPTFSLCIF